MPVNIVKKVYIVLVTKTNFNDLCCLVSETPPYKITKLCDKISKIVKYLGATARVSGALFKT